MSAVSRYFVALVVVWVWYATAIKSQVIYRENKLALLSGTLKTEQAVACDGEFLMLRCPSHTIISIQTASYGRRVEPQELLTCFPVNQRLTPEIRKHYNTSCQSKALLKHSLLQTVISTCHQREQCKLMTSPKTFGGDPCPGVTKWAEVSFKCRPNEFRNKIVCQYSSVSLTCPSNSRIAIYQATFGRQPSGRHDCPQPSGVPEQNCTASYATETIMQTCHGKRQCTLTADPAVFGAPCNPKSHMYLKVIYTCVPKSILILQFQSDDNEESRTTPTPKPSTTPKYIPPSTNGIQKTGKETVQKPKYTKDYPYKPNRKKYPMDVYEDSRLHTDWTTEKRQKDMPKQDQEEHKKKTMKEEEEKKRQIIPIQHEQHIHNHNYPDNHSMTPPDKTQKPPLNCTVPTYGNSRVIGFISEWITAANFLRENSEKMVLYLTLGLVTGLLLFLLVLVARLMIQKRRAKREADLAQAEAFNGPRPGRASSFPDDLSEIGRDIPDVTAPPTGQPPRCNHRRSMGGGGVPAEGTISRTTSSNPQSPTSEAAPEVPRYPTQSRSSRPVARQDSVSNPRSLNRNSNQFYYS